MKTKCFFIARVRALCVILLLIFLLPSFSACNAAPRSMEELQNITSEDVMHFTFEKIDDYSFVNGTSYIMDFGDKYTGEDAALIEGRMLTVFGEPYRITDDEENGYEYIIKATSENGEITYLTVYHAACAHIGGDREALTRAAAEELIEYVNSATPADFERVRYYMDFGVRIYTKVQNGKVSMNSQFLSDSEIEKVYSRWTNEQTD